MCFPRDQVAGLGRCPFFSVFVCVCISSHLCLFQCSEEKKNSGKLKHYPLKCWYLQFFAIKNEKMFGKGQKLFTLGKGKDRII
jgi:hypothetical protein